MDQTISTVTIQTLSLSKDLPQIVDKLLKITHPAYLFIGENDALLERVHLLLQNSFCNIMVAACVCNVAKSENSNTNQFSGSAPKNNMPLMILR